MRQKLIYLSVAIDDVDDVVLFSALPTEDESQALPTFTVRPLVRVVSSNSDRTVDVVATTTTSFTVKVQSGGDDVLPLSIDIEIINRNAVSVSPAPSTDFTTFVNEPLCTPMDVLRYHRRFTPNVAPLSVIFNYCLDTRAIIDLLSKRYSQSSLQTDPWATPVMPSPLYRNQDNYESSHAENAVNRVGCYGVQPASAAFTDMYTITFTGADAFTIDGLIQGNVGSGTTGATFTPGNNDFTIVSDAWFGTFEETHRFYFSINRWYAAVYKLAIAMATGEILVNEYGMESGDEQSLGAKLLESVGVKIDKLLRPDDPDGIRLPSLGARDFNPFALPYNIDMFGRNVTKVSPDNRDRAGELGENVGFWDLLIDEDY